MIKDCARGIVLLKLATDRHEVSRNFGSCYGKSYEENNIFFNRCTLDSRNVQLAALTHC